MSAQPGEQPAAECGCGYRGYGTGIVVRMASLLIGYGATLRARHLRSCDRSVLVAGERELQRIFASSRNGAGDRISASGP